jgi:hypothetical protein
MLPLKPRFGTILLDFNQRQIRVPGIPTVEKNGWDESGIYSVSADSKEPPKLLATSRASLAASTATSEFFAASNQRDRENSLQRVAAKLREALLSWNHSKISNWRPDIPFEPFTNFKNEMLVTEVQEYPC